MIQFLLKVPIQSEYARLSGLFIVQPIMELHYDEPEFEFISWGDPICDSGFLEKLRKNRSPEFIVNNLYGHYYYLLLDRISGELFAGNSMFSILPVYYYNDNTNIFLSESALRIGKYLNREEISRRFILETVLFNYPLFNSSIIRDISLLPANSYFSVSESGFAVIKHTKIEQYFDSSPLPWKKAVGDISDIFLESVKKYLPSVPYVHSLTGGFDSRALVSAGLQNKKQFSCYSFGAPDSKDLAIATKLASDKNIKFINLTLDNSYLLEKSFVNGKEFIENASGTTTFARAHYLFAAKILAKNFNYILTGNFGSEIFRAVHTAGSAISSNLYSLFNATNYEDGISAVEKCKRADALDKETFFDTWEDLKGDIQKLPCYEKGYSGLGKNQRFYVFVFEELFRKYFGAEMINQFKYLKNRTPFLDLEFLKNILKTKLAGIHSEFFEHNPIKRFKGQVLYSNIIKKAYPAFGNILTDKGYKPDDLISLSGKLNVLTGYLRRKAYKTRSDDPYRVIGAWDTNKESWLKVHIPAELFNVRGINSDADKEFLFTILSLSHIIERIKNSSGG